MFDHFVGLALKGLRRHENYDIGTYDSADELKKVKCSKHFYTLRVIATVNTFAEGRMKFKEIF